MDRMGNGTPVWARGIVMIKLFQLLMVYFNELNSYWQLIDDQLIFNLPSH